MATTYLWIKVLHLAAVVVFLGNIFTGLFWKAIADRSGDVKIMAHTLHGIIVSDRWFTIPGVVLLSAAGLANAVMGHYRILSTRWLLWSIVAFAISGAIFAVRIGPLQRQLRDCARAGVDTGALDVPLYRRLSREWEFWGAVSLVLPVLAFILMIVRPRLP